MITTITDFVKELPAEFEEQCEPRFFKMLLANLAALEAAIYEEVKITGFDGKCLTSVNTPEGTARIVRMMCFK